MCQRVLKTEAAGAVKDKVRVVRHEDGGCRDDPRTQQRPMMTPAEVDVGRRRREKDGGRVGSLLK